MPDANRPPRLPYTIAVGITGHRPPVLTEDVAVRVAPVLGSVFDLLEGCARRLHAAHAAVFADTPPEIRLVTPLAEGADQLAAEAALTRGFAVHAVLPLPRDDYREDFGGARAQASFDRLLAQAQCVLELPRPSTGRDAAYALAGRATLAHSDILVAVWDGSAARGRGGTGEIVALALRRGMPVIRISLDVDVPPCVLWSGFGVFVDANEIESVPQRPLDEQALDLVLAALLAPPADPRERGFISEFFAEHERRVHARTEYPLLLAALGVKRLGASAFRSLPYADATRDEWRGFRDACDGSRHGVTAALDQVEAAFSWSDRLAQHFAQSYRSGHVLNFTLGALAVLLALVGLLLPELKLWLALSELTAIAGFVVNTRVGTRRQWHRRWLDYRQLAERVRPMRSLKLLGAAAPPASARRSSGRPPRWTDWYAAAAWRASGCPAGRIEDHAALTRLIVAEEIRPQIAYHRAAAFQMHMLDHRLHLIGTTLFAVSILGCLVFVAAYLIAYDWVRANAATFIALSAGLPALGAAIFGIRVQGDFGGSAERSAATAQDLVRIVEAIEQPGLDLARTTDLVEAAAATMLADLGDWRLAYQQRRLELPG
jgi:hypothetical protein